MVCPLCFSDTGLSTYVDSQFTAQNDQENFEWVSKEISTHKLQIILIAV
jgi:hypothetical protein